MIYSYILNSISLFMLLLLIIGIINKNKIFIICSFIMALIFWIVLFIFILLHDSIVI